MAVAEIEPGMSAELTDDQLLSKLREFHLIQPPMNFRKEDFFATLEQTDITYLIGEATERFASSEPANDPSTRFSVTVTQVHELPLMNRRLNGGPPQTESKVLKVEYLPDPQDTANPLFRLILPVDNGMHFDRGRQSRITHLDKWRHPHTHIMQAGVKPTGSELGPKNSLNALRTAAGLLIETIHKLEDAKQKKLALAAKWQVGFALYDGPHSVSQSLNHVDKLSTRR